MYRVPPCSRSNYIWIYIIACKQYPILLNITKGSFQCNIIKIRSLHLLSIFYWLFTSRYMEDLKTLQLGGKLEVNMNTFCVYRVCSKKHLLDLSVGFCRRVTDWSIYNTFMLTPDLSKVSAFLLVLQLFPLIKYNHCMYRNYSKTCLL